MINISEMQSTIQEWFADAIGNVEVAKVYAEILKESEKQLEFCIYKEE